MLKDLVVWQECTKPVKDTTCTSAHVIHYVCDGSVFLFNVVFMDSGVTLKLVLYQYAFAVVNNLGSSKKKHKIMGVYFMLANVDPFYCSSIDTSQLMLLCNDRDFKYFGHDKLFSTMLSDLRDLETNWVGGIWTCTKGSSLLHYWGSVGVSQHRRIHRKC